ncbi:MAG: hypothetical protein GY884_21680 [Proteobacteria bacterium]|nr:hypothetical protein [Pseudomonadota bacterium]
MGLFDALFGSKKEERAPDPPRELPEQASFGGWAVFSQEQASAFGPTVAHYLTSVEDADPGLMFIFLESVELCQCMFLAHPAGPEIGPSVTTKILVGEAEHVVELARPSGREPFQLGDWKRLFPALIEADPAADICVESGQRIPLLGLRDAWADFQTRTGPIDLTPAG